MHTSTAKIKGKVSELYALNDSLHRRQVLREQEITVHMFTGGKVLAPAIRYHTLARLGLYASGGMVLQVPVKLVAQVRRGCEFDQSLLGGDG